MVDFEIHGAGPNLLLPVNPAAPVEGPAAEQMRAWGADPGLGHTLVEGFSKRFRVIAFDYEGYLQANPKPDTLTPDNLVADLLAVADAAGADTFAYYGYSWLGMAGLQLAIRTSRLSALVMGGYPPLDGPYDAMLAVTAATHSEAGKPVSDKLVEPGDWDNAEIALSKDQTQQFLTLYQALKGFDDHAVQLTIPRLCIVGSADNIQYGERWGNTLVSIGTPVAKNQTLLEQLGWTVELLDGLDHLQAMQAAQILPVVEPWLARQLG
ncbi:alpha/beta fold hydrolase [Streptomyces sp. SID13031]|uniref:alpha/beta fold hydrolase n=1 Tax=Streptomyces sp. SID13031 TaxID=2706046 RepID=UPI0013C8D1CD|nr:alpha/beta fold hydrolase [Streptomyces sp. SID13031]NEA37487.1 alpha/beta fold hydrolase [Streptomyces sp. SID13031]